jgi:hypothetical protein
VCRARAILRVGLERVRTQLPPGPRFMRLSSAS